MAVDTDTGEILCRYRVTNKFRCGRDEKMKLLNKYGHLKVWIQFRDFAYEISVEQILTIFGWKYLLNNVEYIYDSETGEIYYETLTGPHS